MTCTTGQGRRPSFPHIPLYTILYCTTMLKPLVVFPQSFEVTIWPGVVTFGLLLVVSKKYVGERHTPLTGTGVEPTSSPFGQTHQPHFYTLDYHHHYTLCPVLSLVRIPVLWPVLPLTLHDSISWECVTLGAMLLYLLSVAMLSPAPCTHFLRWPSRQRLSHLNSLWLFVDLLNNPELSLVSY